MLADIHSHRVPRFASFFGSQINCQQVERIWVLDRRNWNMLANLFRTRFFVSSQL